MTTRKQLEAEAVVLYPDPEEGVSPTHYLIRAGQHQAHVRAKTITAEQLEAAVMGYMREIGWHMDDAQFIQSTNSAGHRDYMRRATAVLRAAGFYVMEDDDE